MMGIQCLSFRARFHRERGGDMNVRSVGLCIGVVEDGRLEVPLVALWC